MPGIVPMCKRNGKLRISRADVISYSNSNRNNSGFYIIANIERLMTYCNGFNNTWTVTRQLVHEEGHYDRVKSK